ncbi:MAG: biopolymer transporter ExbD [Elusimicrobia bacterium]|nr:biopolymer transporter ExbD [Elusimicrobiota bacterium]
MQTKLGISREKFPLMAEINMIPLIDISLVLLIIFMVVTPFLVNSQIKINLPKTVTGIAPESEPTKIQISARKNFYIDGEIAHKEDLGKLLRVKLSKETNPSVLIEADASVPFETIILAMDQAKLAGANKLGVAVNKEEKNQK